MKSAEFLPRSGRSRERVVIAICVLLGLLVLLGIMFPWRSGRGESGTFATAMHEARQVGMAAKLYAIDHEGHLPDTLLQLYPDYIDTKAAFLNMRLTTPGMVLDDLPEEAVIATKAIADAKRKQSAICYVRADIAVERVQF